MPRIMTAPSCRGVSFSKIFSNRLSVTRPSMATPVSILSSKPTARSKTIRAPIFRCPMITVALATVSIISFNSASSSSIRLRNKRPRPICSRARRSSGWKTTGSATIIMVMAFSRIQLMTCRFSHLLTITREASTISPLTNAAALVFFSMIYILYRKKATRPVSTMSRIPIVFANA